MLDKKYLPFSEAIELLLDEVSEIRMSVEEIPIEEAYERVLAKDVVAPENLPGFKRSTVDGFAVRARDTFGAKESFPAYLKLKGEVEMGKQPDFKLLPGETAYIPTGGMLPEGADAVVMVEHASIAGDLVEIFHPVSPFENVILEDEDVAKGEIVLKAGTVLKPQHIGALAGLGVCSVEVFKKPVVGIILTGDEIVPPDKKPSPGEVRDINSFTLAGLILKAGGIPKKYGIVRDERKTLEEVLNRAFNECDVLLVSGGTSAGTKDMTAELINELGSPGILFHGVRIRPGKPLIGALCKNKPVFGLPGHPVAVFITFELFVKPVIFSMTGVREPQHKKTVKAVLKRRISSQPGRTDFVRVRLEREGEKLFAIPLIAKSGLIMSLALADAILTVPEELGGIEEGEEVEVQLLD